MTTHTQHNVSFFATRDDAQQAADNRSKPTSPRQALSVVRVNDHYAVCKTTVDREGCSIGASYACEDGKFRTRTNCNFNKALTNPCTKDEFAEYLALPVGAIIEDHGKFESEPRWTPELWECSCEGETIDSDGQTVYTVDVLAIDKIRYPELNNATTIHLWETSDGFVSAQVIS